MHPYYGASGRLGDASARAGLVSMAAYLAFWAVAVAIAMKELNERFPRRPPLPDADDATAVLRRRYAQGEIDRSQFLQMREDLQEGP